MPNQRRAGQMFLGFQADLELVRDLDQARGRKDRSQFVREAIAEKLNRMGIRVPDELIYPPARAKIVQIHNGTGPNYSPNEKSGKYASKRPSSRKGAKTPKKKNK